MMFDYNTMSRRGLKGTIYALLIVLLALGMYTIFTKKPTPQAHSYTLAMAFCQEYTIQGLTTAHWYMTTEGFLGVPDALLEEEIPNGTTYTVTYKDVNGRYMVTRLVPSTDQAVRCS